MAYKDPEERRAYDKAYYAANREKMLAKQSAYAATHREELRAKQRAYAAKQPKKDTRAYMKAYHAAHRAEASAYRTKNRERILARSRAYMEPLRTTAEGWARTACWGAKTRAKKSGLEFNIVPQDLLPLPAVCPFTLEPLKLGPKSGYAHPQSPSVDRIKPNQGYVKGNVRVISFKANTLKSDITDPDVFKRLADDARLWSLV